jgi:ParB-like chromosome segregation protein Spo0J
MEYRDMNLFEQTDLDEIGKLADTLCAKIAGLTLESKVDVLNSIRQSLHDISPFKDEPVDLVLWVKGDNIQANDYNPNSVAPPEMKLLERSITADGYTQPIVTWDQSTHREVVDGFHRNRVGKESKQVKARVHGFLPVVSINAGREDLNDRMAATIRHNRARGKHRVDSMSEIVMELKKRCWTDDRIAVELGMEPDEVLRLSQISGLAELFANKDFSQAWEVEWVETKEEDTTDETE